MNDFARPGLGEEKLPPVNAFDNGKVLGVEDGMWKKVEGGGGSSLPAVTSEDNGDVLTVVNGEWDKAAPSGGGGVLLVQIIEDGNVWTLDKTWKEIKDAMYAGTQVVVKMPEQGYEPTINLMTNVREDINGTEFKCGYYDPAYLEWQNFATTTETGYPQFTFQ